MFERTRERGCLQCWNPIIGLFSRIVGGLAEALDMSRQNAATVEPGIAPSVHVWMTLDKAAQTLGTPAALVSCQIELGELESRLSDEGAAEVLIALPPRCERSQAAERVGVSIVADKAQPSDAGNLPSETIPALAGALVPMLQSMRQAQLQEVRGAKRSARMAWSFAAVMLLAISAGAALGVRAIALSRQRLSDMNEKAQRSGAEIAAVAAERDALRSRLSEAREAAARVEGELAVERQVEDTLFKAALASHASGKTPANSPVFANGAD